MQISTHEKTVKVLLIKLNVRTNEFKKRKFQKHFQSIYKSDTLATKKEGRKQKIKVSYYIDINKSISVSTFV